MKKILIALSILAMVVGCATFSLSKYWVSKRESCDLLANRELPKIFSEKKCFEVVGPRLLASENGKPLSAALFLICAEDVFAFLLANEEDEKLLELNVKQAEKNIGQCKVEEEGGRLFPMTLLLIPMHAKSGVAVK